MELEQIQHNLNEYTYTFFRDLREQIELPLFFIGSIARNDFIDGKSDLDIEVFSDNVVSTKTKLDYLFDCYQKDDRYLTYSIENNPISGYKYYYNNKEKALLFDFTLYKKECQKLILYYRDIEINIPINLSVILIIIKYLHYYFNIIDKPTYSMIKKKFWRLYINKKTGSTTMREDEYKIHYDKAYQKKYLI